MPGINAENGNGLVVPRPSLDDANTNAAVGGGGGSTVTTTTTTTSGGANSMWANNTGRSSLESSRTGVSRSGNLNVMMHSNNNPNSSVGSSILSTMGGMGGTSDNDTEVSIGISFPEIDGRDPQEQLETLKEMLEKTTRIKEGAVNFLKMDIDDSIRKRVESELGQANGRIHAINKAIDAVQNKRKKPSGPRNQSPVVGRLRPDAGQSLQREDGGEDLRSAKQQATLLLKTLKSYARSPLLSGGGSNTSMPSLVAATTASSASTSAGSPPPSTEMELEKARTEAMVQLTNVLQRHVRVRYEVSTDELVAAVSPSLADRASTRSRACAYRLLRHSLVDKDSVERLLEHSLDWYIVKSLQRDNKHAAEREQVVKLIRAIVEVGAERNSLHLSAGLGRVPLSEPIMRALIAVADHPDDPFKNICCETLVEILLIDVDLTVRTGGTRVLFQALAEGPTELISLIAMAFLYIVDAPKTRAYMHPGTDLEIALCGITDAYGKGIAHTERMRSTGKVANVILRTWSGLMYLCLNDMLAIRTMINTLRIPSLETREVVLDMFFELLNIEMPEWYKPFIDGRRLTMYRRHRPLSQQVKTKEAPIKSTDKFHLTDHFLGLLTAVLTKAGILDALIAMLEESTLGSNLTRKATLLMGEILQIANRVLPLSFAAKLQSIPRIFSLSADYTDPEHRIVGTTALAAIDSFNRHRSRLQPITTITNSRQRANSVEDHVRRGQRQVEQVKIKMAMQMDDKTFQGSIIDTQVMLTRDYTKWNYDTLLDLIEGPLLNAKRLEEAIRVSKFIKRLMTFFHPENRRFSEIRKSKTNLKWIKLGCTLLTTLMANADGVRYLQMEDELLPQIVKGFRQLDPILSSTTASDFDPIFSKKRVEETLTSGYLEMLGTLSKQKDGLELLERHKIFTAFYRMSELRSREDLIKGIIENLDYTSDGHPRIVLSKALTSSYKHIRLFATRHLGVLIQATPTANAWMLRLLLTQLYDPDPAVSELAVQFLEEACQSQDILKIVVDMHPTLEHLGEVANTLLFKFMATPVGFRYLYDVGFIERELDVWLHERNLQYVVEIETYLSRELNLHTTEEFEEEQQVFDSVAPTHFYGELAKTDLGCQVLQEKGHFLDFAHFVRQHALESDDLEIIFRLKSVLWAVGNIATGEGGLHFLEEEEIIPVVIEIAESSPVLSLRGTCFFILGLISSTAQGAEILDDYGWESTLSPLGAPTGLCIPSDLDKFVSIPAWSQPEQSTKRVVLTPPTSQEELDVLTTIGNLANTVIANTASRSLAKMKSKAEFRHAFSSPSLYYRVLHMISTQRLRLPVRRFILELFDVPLDSNTVRVLSTYAKTLREPEVAPDESSTEKPKPRLQPRVSIFGRPTRGAASQSSSDESMEDLDMDSSDEEKPPRKPLAHERPVSLMPVKRVAGFDGHDMDEAKDKEGEANAKELPGRPPVALPTRRNLNGSKYRRRVANEDVEDDEF